MSNTQFIPQPKAGVLRSIEYYHNHKTGEFRVTFGIPFDRCGVALFNLPAIKDGKKVHVLGLTPYTVEKVMQIKPNMWEKANGMIDAYHNNAEKLIEALTPLEISA